MQKTILVALLLFTATTSRAAASVTVVPGTVKVQPSDRPSGNSAANISAAKNEVESFQVVLMADGSAVSGVRASMSTLTDAAGQALDGTVELFREGLLSLANASGADGKPGTWPDALIPDVDGMVHEQRNAFPLDVPANEARAIWVDVRVAVSAAAGVYNGVLSITGGLETQVPVQVTVRNFALPSTSTLRSAFGLSWNGPCVGHWNDATCANENAEVLRQRYLATALDNRISIETAPIQPPIAPDGSESHGGWAHFDAVYGPFLDGNAATQLVGAKLTALRIYGQLTTAVARAWGNHFTAKGWHNQLFAYVCDEPPLTCQWSDVTERANAVHAGDSTLKTLVTTSIQAKSAQAPNAPIDILVPVVNWLDDKPTGGTYPGDQRPLYDSFVASGGELWWYQSCMSHGCAGIGGAYGPSFANDYSVGWPTYAIDSSAVRNRAQEWMSFGKRITGELYYETTTSYYSGNPWTNAWNFGGNGDGTLFYPGKPSAIGGTTDIPVESIRLKEIRDGMEDYEYLHLAEQLGMGDAAREIVSGLFPHVYQSDAAVAALADAREQVAQLIEKTIAPAATSAGTESTSTSSTTSTSTSTTSSTASSSATASTPENSSSNSTPPMPPIGTSAAAAQTSAAAATSSAAATAVPLQPASKDGIPGLPGFRRIGGPLDRGCASGGVDALAILGLVLLIRRRRR